MLTAAVADSARYSFAAHLAVLRSCPDVMSHLLKTGDLLLPVAKVLVLSRLLHTKLSQRATAPPYLDTLRNRIASLRRRLLGRIDRRFKSLEMSRDVLVETMCAFSLATSSSPKDVLRHYHHTRLEAMLENMEDSANGNGNMLLALRLYVKTLRETQAVIPGQLATALEKLKSISLFKSPELMSLTELNLDVHERWIAEDIKTFTPYIRHDDMSKAEVERSSKQWANQAFSSFLKGLRNRIQDVRDPSALMQLRRDIIELWLSNHHHSLGIDTAETLDGLRDVFNAQATRIIRSRASTMDHVISSVQNALQDWRPGSSDVASSLWEPSMTSIEMSKGGKDFRDRLMNRSIGSNEPLDRVCKEYSIFLEEIKAMDEVIKKLGETRWADVIDDVDDDDDLLDNKQALLSVDDPGLLQDVLNTALQKAYTDLQVMLRESSPDANDQSRGQKSSFLIRVWRELRQHLPKSYQYLQLGSDSIPTLHSIVADEVLGFPLMLCNKRVNKISKTSGIQTRPLWEGDPELPVLPSAWTYRFLIDLVSSMGGLGSDLWTPHAVDALKRKATARIAPLFEEGQEAAVEQVNGRLNGDAGPHEEEQQDHPEQDHVERRNEDEDEDEVSLPVADKPSDPTSNLVNGVLSNGTHKSKSGNETRNARIQQLFDVSYLLNALAVKDMDADENELMQFQDSLAQKWQLEAKAVQRIKKDAGEYWKRTCLLFALLA